MKTTKLVVDLAKVAGYVRLNIQAVADQPGIGDIKTSCSFYDIDYFELELLRDRIDLMLRELQLEKDADAKVNS